MVKIKYWIQDTMESGHWEETEPMERSEANTMLDLRVFDGARVIKVDSNKEISRRT